MDLQQLFQKETTLMLGTANFNQINIDYILRIFEYNNKFQIIKKHFTVYNISVSPNPVGTHRCFNVEERLKSSCNVDKPLFNVDLTLRFQRLKSKHISTLSPR